MAIEAQDSILEKDPQEVVFIFFYYMGNYLLALFALTSLSLDLVIKIYECIERARSQRAIEELEEKKEIATGNEEPCPICFCEY